jgi:hypothetical protein
MDPGSSASFFRLSLIGLSFPIAASEFRKDGLKHEVTSMFVALGSQCTGRPDVPLEPLSQMTNGKARRTWLTDAGISGAKTGIPERDSQGRGVYKCCGQSTSEAELRRRWSGVKESACASTPAAVRTDAETGHSSGIDFCCIRPKGS